MSCWSQTADRRRFSTKNIWRFSNNSLQICLLMFFGFLIFSEKLQKFCTGYPALIVAQGHFHHMLFFLAVHIYRQIFLLVRLWLGLYQQFWLKKPYKTLNLQRVSFLLFSRFPDDLILFCLLWCKLRPSHGEMDSSLFSSWILSKADAATPPQFYWNQDHSQWDCRWCIYSERYFTSIFINFHRIHFHFYCL